MLLMSSLRPVKHSLAGSLCSPAEVPVDALQLLGLDGFFGNNDDDEYRWLAMQTQATAWRRRGDAIEDQQ